MHTISLNFQVHQPFQYRTYRFFDIGKESYYANDFQNKYLTDRSAERCYIQATNLLLDMMKIYGDSFKVSFSISGITLDLFEKHNPDIIKGFKALAETGNVEFLATPYHHSLTSIRSTSEFIEQSLLHKKRIQELFKRMPTAFSNTELIYSDEIGKTVYDMGFETMLTEGAKHVLGWKSPNFVYHNAIEPKLKVLLRNYQLSDDIAFRFSNTEWDSYPLTAEKFTTWIKKAVAEQECVNICLDYRVLGEWQSKETGIFEFFKYLPKALSENSDIVFTTPSELATLTKAAAPIYIPYPISWSGDEKDLSLWTGNDLQKDALSKICELKEKIMKIQNPALTEQWRVLQSADNFYWMNTKQNYVQGLHNPFHSPYDAFINHMNIISDLALQVENSCAE